MVVVVFSDWDADGVISAAEIFYSQNILGVYPVEKKREVVLIPTSVKNISKEIEVVVSSRLDLEYVVFLDIAYSKTMKKNLFLIREKGVEILYVDHHISTAIHIDELKPVVNNLVFGKAATAVLVYNLLKSRGIDVSKRLKAFIEAVAMLEKEKNRKKLMSIDQKLVDIVANISRTLVMNKDKDLWIKIVKWLTQPLPILSIPFATDIKYFVEKTKNNTKDIKLLANEIALSALRIFNVRFIDIRNKKYPYKITSIASSLHRLLKTPIIILAKNKHGKEILVTKSCNSLAYDIALYLYKNNLAEDVVGHETLTISLLKPGVSKENLIQIIRKIIVNGPAGI